MGQAASSSVPLSGNLPSLSLEQLIEAVPIGTLILDGAGKIVAVNDMLLFKFGYERGALAGQYASCLMADQNLQDFVHEPPSMYVEGGSPITKREVTARHFDGRTFPAELRIQCLDADAHYGLFMVAVADIQNLKREEGNFRRIVENAPCGMVLVDSSGRIAGSNQMFNRIFGYTSQELGGKPVEMLIPERFRSGPEGLRESFTAASSDPIMGRGRDLVGLHRDGTEIPVEVALSTVETAQGPSFLAGVIDISARKGLELELRQANANLEEFTYVASHDLRSPLRGLADLFQWISDDIADLDRPSVSKNLERARIRVERLERIIEDLLTYARSARTSYDYDDIEVGKLIARMIELQPRPADFSINVHCEVDSIRAIRAPLETVLRNLVSNAVKHHDRGDGCIDISVALDDTYCIFTVSDDGPGIPKEFMGRVFKLFQTMTSTERGGTGLGLAVTKRLVERHGGQITLDSEGSTRGATFRVRWPRFPRKMNDDQPSA